MQVVILYIPWITSYTQKDRDDLKRSIPIQALSRHHHCSLYLSILDPNSNFDHNKNGRGQRTTPSSYLQLCWKQLHQSKSEGREKIGRGRREGWIEWDLHLALGVICIIDNPHEPRLSPFSLYESKRKKKKKSRPLNPLATSLPSPLRPLLPFFTFPSSHNSLVFFSCSTSHSPFIASTHHKYTPRQTMTSFNRQTLPPCDKVLGIQELLESILLYLDFDDPTYSRLLATICQRWYRYRSTSLKSTLLSLTLALSS